MRKKYWTTKEGVEIEYSKLEDSHLLNIIKWIENKSVEGITIVSGGGGWGIDDMWFDEEYLVGDSVKKYYDYKDLMKEALRRKLITENEYILRT